MSNILFQFSLLTVLEWPTEPFVLPVYPTHYFSQTDMFNIVLNLSRYLKHPIKLKPIMISSIRILPTQQLGPNSNRTHHIQLCLHMLILVSILHLESNLVNFIKQSWVTVCPSPTLEPFAPVDRADYVVRDWDCDYAVVEAVGGHDHRIHTHVGIEIGGWVGWSDQPPALEWSGDGGDDAG